MGLKVKSARLPVEYIELQYVRCKGVLPQTLVGGSFIDTGLCIDCDNWEVHTKFNMDSAGTVNGLFGAQNGTPIFTAYTGSWYCNNGQSGGTRIQPNTWIQDAIQDITITGSNGRVNITGGDGTGIKSYNNPTDYSNSTIKDITIALGTNHNLGLQSTYKSQCFYGDIYYWSLKKGGVLVGEFIPAKRVSDNYVGFYETVTETFFERHSDSTYPFEAGPLFSGIAKEVKELYTGISGIKHYIGDIYQKNPNYSILPSGYQLLEYIEADGNQYLNTGITVSSNSKVSIRCERTGTTNSCLFGARTSMAMDDSFLIWSYIQASNNCRWDLGTHSVNSESLPLNTIHELSKIGPSNYVDGIAVEANEIVSVNCPFNAYLFAGNQGDSTIYQAKARVYNCKIWQNGTTLSRNFIPCKNASNVVGMYDSIGQQFYSSATEASFIAGPVTPQINKIFNAGYDTELTGTDSFALADARTTSTSWKINGQSSQTSVPTPTNPVDVYGCGNSGLPNGYKKLEYLQSNGTQYIDTENRFIASTDTLEVKYENTGGTTNFKWAFGSYGGSSLGITTGSGTLHNNMYYSNVLDIDSSYFTGSHTLLTDNNGVSIDGTNVVSYVNFTTSSNLYLFATNNSGAVSNNGNYKIYSYKQTRDGSDIINFIPAQRKSDGVLGMYDTVTNTFFTNAGTGTFIAGPEDTSCTISINWNRQVPMEYTQYDYIQSSGIQYIDTGIKPTQNTRVLYSCAVLDDLTGIDSHLFGSRTTATSKAFDLAFMNQNTFNETLRFIHNDMNADIQTSLITTSTIKNKHEYDMSGAYVKVDGTSITTFSTNAFTGDYNLWIGAVNNAGIKHDQARSQKIYGCKIWESNTLMRELIPVKRNRDNVIGMYDIVSGAFFTNTGTGAFTAGLEIGTIYSINLSSPLQKIGVYIDSIESDGTLTRGIGVKVFDGTESWIYDSTYSRFVSPILSNCVVGSTVRTVPGYCSHYKILDDGRSIGEVTIGDSYIFPYEGVSSSQASILLHDSHTSVNDFKAWLAAQYLAGIPVIVYYPLANATTTTISVPTISSVSGTNYVKINTEIEPSITNLTYRRKYKNYYIPPIPGSDSQIQLTSAYNVDDSTSGEITIV